MLFRVRTVLNSVLLTSLTLALPVALHAQYGRRATYGFNQPSLPAFQITPFAGYMDFGHYINGSLGSNLAFDNGAIVGTQASLAFSRNFALYGEVGYANSSNNGSYVNPYNGFVSSAGSGMWVYDGGIQLQAPFRAEDRHWVVPFLQVGAGAVTYRISDGFNTNTDTRFAWNGGVGLDYHFTRNVGIRLMAKDYIATFSVPASGSSTNTTTGVMSSNTTTTNNNNWSFNAGLNFGF